MKIIFPYLIYPAILALASLAYWGGIQIIAHPLFGAYAAVSSASVFIFFLEKLKPLHKEWIPTKEELTSEVFFYSLFVQAIFPIMLFFVGKNMLMALGYHDGIILDLWPHHLPKFYQFLIVLIGGEFFQYWWHRLAHSYKVLWPVHAIHHFPKKLYAWNTAHFHFLDKFVELLFTVLIFFAFGLSVEVFTFYYVFYAITGFVQHSNLDIKLGWLDYVIASGETHRFHHDANTEKSQCNYANNVVFFDLLFGTFKRAPEEILVDVGIKKGPVPETLLEEITFPFLQIKKFFFDLFFKLAMNHVGRTKVKKLELACENPRLAQESFLLNLVDTNKETSFGKEHNFSQIKSYADFKHLVPIREYEELRSYVEAIFKGADNSLTKNIPFYFTKTSGTTGLPKYIPVNSELQKSILDAQQILSHHIYLNDPDFLTGDIFSIVGKEVEELLFSKFPCGSMSGKLHSLAHPLVRAKHVFHKDIALMDDPAQKYVNLAALALLSPGTTFFVSPNPATLLKIFEIINTQRKVLRELLSENENPIFKKYAKNTDHALSLLNSKNDLTISVVWPNLRVVSLWKEGSCSYLIPKIRNQIPRSTQLIELGYICSEFYGTVPVGKNANLQVPAFLGNFYEFIEKEDYERGSRETLLIDQLETNKEYYVIVTTSGGLYRYFINDIVKVTGFYKQAPLLAFSLKGRGITNIMGEKLSEKQLVSFFESINSEKETVSFFICLADQKEQSYKMYVEFNSTSNCDELERELNAYLKKINIEFESKINDGRLAPIKVLPLSKNTSELYREHCLKNGQRESQFKFLHLQYAKDVQFSFSEFIKK